MIFAETIPFLLAQMATFFKVELEKSMAAADLHGGQVFVLFELWSTDGLSQIDLAKALNVSPPTINKMVKSLADNRFVKCRKSKTDGRLMRVFLTEKGLGVRTLVEERWLLLADKVYFGLTETEKLMLFQLFEKVRHNLLPGRNAAAGL